MSIATAITNLQGKIANAYTAIENKGGTLPATQNAENLSATIDGIPAGAKFGATIDDVFQTTTTGNETTLNMFGGVTDLTFTGVTKIPEYGMASKFQNSQLSSISFPALKRAMEYAFANAFKGCTSLIIASFPELSASDACSFQSAFEDCTNLTNVSFPNIVVTNGLIFNSAFKNCASLTSISFPEAITIGANAFKDAFHGCTNLTTVSFPKVATITSTGAFSTAFGTGQSAYPAAGVTYLSFPALTSIVANASAGSTAIFYNNKKITRIDLPALTEMKKSATATTDNLVAIFNGCDDLVEIHFGEDNQTVIEASDGYATKWGAPNANCQIYFDL